MLLSEVQAYLDEEFDYPIELAAVIERVGTVEIEGANDGESETIRSILEPLGTDTFESSAALSETIYGNVSDDFIGRKYYDDRGGNPADVGDEPREEDDISF